MRIPTALPTLLPLFLATLLPITTTAKVLSKTSFGIDPLIISTFGGFGPTGRPNVTSVLYDPENAHTGPGYLSITWPDPASLPAGPPNESKAQYVTFVQPLVLKSNRTYTSHIWAKSPAPDGNCFVSIGYHANDGSLLNITDGEVVGKKWEKYQISVESDDSQGSAGASYFYASCTGGVAETVFLDDYEVSVK